MSCVLDSNIVLYHLGAIPDAVALVSRLAPEGIAISIVTYMEVYQSTLRSSDQEQAQTQLAQFLSAVPVLPFSSTTARRCAELREQLAQEGKRVRQRALEHHLTLVTANREDFHDIPDLPTLFYTGV